MDRRGLAESLGAGLGTGLLTTVAQLLVVDTVSWIPVVGLVLCVALAAAANYRARTGHAETVASEAPEVTAENYEKYTPVKAGDGGTGQTNDDHPGHRKR